MTEFPPPDDHESEVEPEALPLPDADPIDELAAPQVEHPASDDGAFSDDDLIAAASAANEAEPELPADDSGQPEADEPTFDDTTDTKAGDPSQPLGPDPTQAQPPPPPYGAGPAAAYGGYPSARRLYRSRHDRRLGGVSAGIAEYFGVDPTIVRLVTFALAITGVGILVYLAAWLIVPLRPEGFVDVPRTGQVANEGTMTLAFGIAALALAFGIITDSWALLAIALIGGGIWLLSERTIARPAIDPGGFAGAAPGRTPAPFSPPAPRTYEPIPYTQAPPRPRDDVGRSASGGAPPPPTFAPYVPSPAPPREKQRITWTVLSVLALLAAIGIAASSGDWWNVSAIRFLGIGVIIIGVGVVIGQIRGGGARGLIPLGILGALMLFPVSAVDGLLDDGVGEANYRPTTFAELEDTYEHGIGKLVVDLSRLDFEGRSESIDIDLGIGELVVVVSQDTGGQAVLQATAGEVKHFIPETNSFLFEDGVNVETGTVSLEGDNGTLELNINVGLGTAELRSEAN